MTVLPKTDAVETECRNGWLTLWLNQPENRNALSADMVADLVNVLETVRDDRTVRGITLRGRGGTFCAGGDLKSFSASQANKANFDALVESSKEGAYFFDLVNTMPQPVIALIEGYAMAGGFGLACCADVVICTSDARFALTEIAIGLIPAQIAPFVIQRLGATQARRLMLTATRFDGLQAQAHGLADHVVENRDDLNTQELQIRQQVLACGPEAVAETKDLILKIPGLPRTEVIQIAAEKFARRMQSDEGAEGITAFVQKRQPNWVKKP